jgi:hypothetical protein
MRAGTPASASFEARRRRGEHLRMRTWALSKGVRMTTTLMEHNSLPHPEVLDRACDRASKDAQALIPPRSRNHG